MQIRTFTLRLEKESFNDDMAHLNSFLETVRISKTSSVYIENEPDMWSVIVHYYEELPQPDGIQQVKVFRIRLESEFREKDEQRINSFLETVDFKKSAVKFRTGEHEGWSLLVYYILREDQDALSINAKTGSVQHFKKDDTARRSSPVRDTHSTGGNRQPKVEYSDLSSDELVLLDVLRSWRDEKAMEGGLPKSRVFADFVLRAIARRKPASIEELLLVNGIRHRKIEQYGKELLDLLNAAKGGVFES